jgi:tetratricopeptide (TPR) repeat protein
MINYRFILVCLVAGFSWMTPVNAQNSKLQMGKDHFMDGSYEKALVYFNQVISQSRSMTPEMLTEAYYYRGLTFVRLHNEAFTGENKEAQKLYKDALLSAYRDYKASVGYDNGDLWKKIDLEIKNLHHALLQEGLASLNEYNELVYTGKTDTKLLSRAEDYLVSAHEIRETYLVCDLLGQVYLDKGQKKEAADFFAKSEKLYTEKLPEEPDFLMAYVFYRLAAIHKPDDIRLAMQDDQRGINLMVSEYDRFNAIKGKLTPERAKQMEDQYQLAIQDLNNLKLDLYLSNADLYVEALNVFEEELSKNPDNVDLLIGYASLLEKSDKEKAIITYQKALSSDPANKIALFNLGALYYAKGKDLFDAAQNTTEDKQFEILIAEATASFEKAKPYFEQALAADPSSLEAIRALKTIAYVLDDQDAYNKYKEMESKAGPE